MPSGSDVPDWAAVLNELKNIKIKTYTVTEMPSDWGADNAAQYVWVIPPAGNGDAYFVPAKLNASTIEFRAFKAVDKVRTVRMKSTVTNLDLNGPDVLGKSQELKIENNTAKYVADPSGSSGTVKTYTVTDMPEWWGNESAKQYVWLFKTGAPEGVGSWVSAELQGNTIKFTTSETFDKVVTARMKSSVTNPDSNSWKTDVLNQSLDIEMPSGQTTAKFYYTVTEMPSHWGNANAKQYVRVIKTGKTESWVPAELQGNTIKFSTSNDFDIVITVRMDPTHPNIPSWDAKWNQSADLTVTNNTAVYAP